MSKKTWDEQSIENKYQEEKNYVKLSQNSAPTAYTNINMFFFDARLTIKQSCLVFAKFNVF